jgi:hypothetical protein
MPDKEKTLDWLYRLRSEIYVFMPKEWLIPMNNALDMAIKALEQEPKWIPISERLPESSGVYIVSRWFSDGEESAILTDANYYDGCGEWYNDNRINWGRELVTKKIVAWMPLPDPYKEEE